MIKKHSRPRLLQGLMLAVLHEWRSRLATSGKLNDPRFDSALRFGPVVFMAAERLRENARLREAPIPVPAEFLDWVTQPALQFFRSKVLERAVKILINNRWMHLNVTLDTNYTLTQSGRDALDDVHFAFHEEDLNFAGFAAIDRAVQETASAVVGMSAKDFREYFLAVSFKMYNEDRDNELIEFSERYLLVDYAGRSSKLRDVRDYSRLLGS